MQASSGIPVVKSHKILVALLRHVLIDVFAVKFSMFGCNEAKKKRLLQIEDWMKLLLHLVEPRVHRASVLSRRQCAVMLRTLVLPYL